MIYFKDQNNKLYAFEDDVQETIIRMVEQKHGVTLIQITEEEYNELIKPPFDELKELKKYEIKQLFLNKLNQGYTCSNNITMDSDITDIQKLRDGAELTKSLNQTEITIRDFNNQLHTLSVTDVEQMLIELGINYQNLLKIKWDLEDQVNQAQSEDELNNIDLIPLQ